jgi:hypothetical protein
MRESKKHYKNEKELSSKRKCPDKLNDLICRLRIIPEKAVLPDYGELRWDIASSVRDYLREFGDISSPSIEERRRFDLSESRRIFNQCFLDFSEEFKENLLKTCKDRALEVYPNYDKWRLEMMAFGEAGYYHQSLYDLNVDFRAIANFFSHLRKGSYKFANETELVTSNGESIRLPLFTIQLKREGTIGKVKSEISDAFHNVDLDRIRACEICDRIFWAKRTESSTCSPKHYEALKKRRARALTDEEKAERKTKRQENKRYKQNQQKGNK